MIKDSNTPYTNHHLPVAIIGGGMVGMALGIALAESSLPVTIVDRAEQETQLQPEFDGRVSAIAWGSYKFLDSIGVWKFLAEHAEPINDIRVSEFGSGLFLHFDHEEIGNEPFGFIVENRHIRHALHLRAASLSNLRVIAPAEVVEIGDWRLEIKENHQSSIINHQLLIGADGKNSQVRKLAGIECVERDYKQTAIVCTIVHELPHLGLAHEHFIPTGPFAVLPLKGRMENGDWRLEDRGNANLQSPISNLSSLVWTEPAELAPLYMKMPEDEFNAQIAKRVKHLGAVKALPGRWSYPLRLSHAKEYVRGNIVLVGDAAHSIHPIAGQGVNLGFRDAKLLAGKLAESAKLGLGFESALASYASQRRLDNKLMIAATDGINRLFSNNILPLKLARDVGLGAVNQIPALRKFFMRYASGKI